MILAFIHPVRAFDELKNKPAPLWGLGAVLIRFFGGSLLGAILLLLLPNHIPFEHPYFTLFSEDAYYAAQVFFLPLFGIAIWLLMSSTAHVILRLSGKTSQFDQILNIIGIWGANSHACRVDLGSGDDSAKRISNHSHVDQSRYFSIRLIAIESVGLMRILGIKSLVALGLAALINVVFILGAMLFIR